MKGFVEPEQGEVKVLRGGVCVTWRQEPMQVPETGTIVVSEESST